MKALLKIVVVLPGVLLIVMGLRWLVSPAGIAPDFGFVLADGLGRSSQVGDFAAFFLTTGSLYSAGRRQRSPAVVLPSSYAPAPRRDRQGCCLGAARRRVCGWHDPV